MVKLSVIIPVYNVEKYLRQCLDSIVNQTYKDLEIILVNDGSKDKSGDICREYAEKDNRIIFIDKENGGVVSAYTEGFKYVTSEYVTFVDSDDWIELSMYKVMMSKMLEDKDLDLVVCDYKINFDEKFHLNLNEEDFYISNDYFFPHNKKWLSCVKCNKIYTRQMLSLFINKLNKKCLYGEDIMIHFSVMLNSKKRLYLHNSFYNYRKVLGRGIHTVVSSNMEKNIVYEKDYIDNLPLNYEDKRKAYYMLLDGLNGIVLRYLNSKVKRKKEIAKEILASDLYEQLYDNCCFIDDNLKKNLINVDNRYRYYSKLSNKIKIVSILEKTKMIYIYRYIRQVFK